MIKTEPDGTGHPERTSPSVYKAWTLIRKTRPCYSRTRQTIRMMRRMMAISPMFIT